MEEKFYYKRELGGKAYQELEGKEALQAKGQEIETLKQIFTIEEEREYLAQQDEQRQKDYKKSLQKNIKNLSPARQLWYHVIFMPG